MSNQDCSEDYPIGGMIERYDIEKEKELCITKPTDNLKENENEKDE